MIKKLWNDLKKKLRGKLSTKDLKGAIKGEKWAIADYKRILDKNLSAEDRRVFEHILTEEEDHLRELEEISRRNK